VRGHLALCQECRTLAQRWNELADQVDELVRSTMRERRMPDVLLERMLAAGAPSGAGRRSWRALLASPWLLRALVPIAVVAAILALVVPGVQPEQAAPAPTGAASVDQRDLVQRALGTLYQRQSGGVWHERYALRWVFADGSYAPLIGEIWSDAEQGQQRIQLTHESGGAPYEFSLGDGRGTVWYAVTRTYGESIYPLVFDPNRTRVRLTLSGEQERQLREAQLANGAWNMPAAYLRQAIGVQLQSWGRQRGDDGAALEVIGFKSARALTGSAPEGVVPTTVLLFIEPGSGQLREIREVIGPQGGDQISRSIWRLISAERMTERPEIDRAFNLTFAWNGIGGFSEVQNGMVRPELPLANQRDMLPPRVVLRRAETRLLMPASPPPQATTATALASSGRDRSRLTLLYTGDGRRMAIQSLPDTPSNEALFSTDGNVEALTLGQRAALVRAVPGGYEALLRPVDPAASRTLALVVAQGYTRDETVETLSSIVPISIDVYQAQARLFASFGQARDASDLLLSALQAAPPSEDGAVQRTTVRVFQRQAPARTDLPDPFHRPVYNGLPSEVFLTTWQYPGQPSASPQYTELRGGNGQVYATSYTGPEGDWYHTATINTTVPDASDAQMMVHMGRVALLSALVCGGVRLERQPYDVTIVQVIEPVWTATSCLRPELPGLLRIQQGSAPIAPDYAWDDGVFVADMGQRALALGIALQGGKLAAVELRGGTASDGELIERWELVSSDRIPAAEAPPLAERQAAPVGVDVQPRAVNSIYNTALLQAITLTDTLELLGVPLYEPRPELQPQHFVIANGGSAAGGPLSVIVQSISDTPFEQALWHGVAAQTLLQVDNGVGGSSTLLLYQGSRERFGAFLRAQAAWRASAAASFELGGQQVQGWSVIPEGSDDAYIVADVDGTVIAFATPLYFAEWGAIGELQRVDPPARPGPSER
jgi:hypothetical protein